VPGQGAGIAGRAMASQIVGRGAYHQTLGSQPSGGQIGVIGKLADPYGQIDPFTDQLGRALAEGDRKIQTVMTAGQFEEGRQDMATPEGARQGHPQHAHRAGPSMCQSGLHPVEIFQNAEAGFQIGLPFMGQRQAAGGAMQQFGAQAFFQPRHALAHGGAGDAQFGGGGRKAARAGRGDEFGHAVEAVVLGHYGMMGWTDRTDKEIINFRSHYTVWKGGHSGLSHLCPFASEEFPIGTLFEAFDLSGLRLSNRVVMAPMTRARAETTIPDDHTVAYYSQRAGAGLIISEGAPVSIEGRGYLFNPGLYLPEQVAGWKRVTDAVHAGGGRIFAQLWHVGRMSHVSLQPDGRAPVTSTAIRAHHSCAFARDEIGSPALVPASQPRALETEEVVRITQDFVRAARMAIEAGFDGVELHGANGYLFEQFINGALNQRGDRYGGSIWNRLRFMLETIDALIAEVGGARVGVRISPFGRLFDMQPYEDEATTWVTLAGELDRRSLAYVHLSDQLTIGAEKMPGDFAASFRQTYRGTLIAAGGFDKASGEAALQSGELDLIAYGRPFIANPDLVERMRHDWPLAVPDRATFYGSQGTKGYTDYPVYDPADAQSA
jgi:N-ethylmaleimide reductase